MKPNKSMTLLVLFFIVAGVSGALLSSNLTRDDAIDDLRDRIRPARQAELDQDVPVIIQYTNDKTCHPDYDTEEILCELCFNFNYTIRDEMLEENRCVSVPEGTTLRQDDTKVKRYVDGFVQGVLENLEPERALYENGTFTGRELNYNSTR